MTTETFTDNERTVLYELSYWYRKGDKRGVRPLDIGGRNGSHHSYTLTKLVKRGLVSRAQRSAFGGRGSFRYKLTDAGAAALAALDNKSVNPTA